MANQTHPKVFPSEWSLGKPRGSIKTNPTNYQLRICDQNIYFLFRDYPSNEKAYEACQKKQMEISDAHNLTRNKLRYIDKDTIEIQLTSDRTFKTDSKFIDKVEKYLLSIKEKKTPNGSKFYVNYYDNVHAPFTNLITDYKTIRFINEDSLDLRLSNLQEAGVITVNEKVKSNDYNAENQYEYFELLKNNKINQLPKDKWILGKPTGTIFNRKDEPDIYTVAVTDENGKKISKTLNIKNYNNSHKKTKIEAEKLKINMSYNLGVTKNLIKIHDDYIEVKINDKFIFKTDKIYLKLINSIPIFASFGYSEKYYPATICEEKNIFLHRLITQYNNDYLVDHINGDTMDNRLSNLRPVNHSLNNINRHIEVKGYKEVDTIFGKAIKVSTKLDKKEYSKYYSVDKFGYDNAIQLAKDFRQKVLSINTFDDTFIDGLDTDEDKIMLKYLVKILDKHKFISLTSVNYNKTKYFENFNSIINLDSKYKNEMFRHYILNQIDKYNKLMEMDNKIGQKIKDIMYKHFMEHMDNRRKFYLFKKL